MALLTLQNIGKIYVSDTNLAVGIRGVNLSFDRGEFVAVTGKSGSGKSTLLNVISGMDTYEEGELFIEGEPTSHFRQSDWETYRQNYISFIFQDYNILESFTVLQNVELALLHIEDPKERRARALELIRRVGLEKHIRHKGSQLSGGQKQRTVIARALAKDSPIILADEPTGNLDSQTSAEIIELLREVSRDKLVIVVTHNFDEVRAYATRHVRIFDGAVEADEVITRPSPVTEPIRAEREEKSKGTAYFSALKSGLHLGAVRFFAMPKLSVFLCLLMILTSLILTVVTATNSSSIFEKEENYQFSHIDGRAVIIRRDGATITDDELSALAAKVGAKTYLHYDNMLDETLYLEINQSWEEVGFAKADKDFSVQYGRVPEKENEVAIAVPLSYRAYFGSDNFTPRKLSGDDWFGSIYTLTGVSYYVDNTVMPTVTFTEAGYATASEIAFFSEQIYNFGVNLFIKVGGTVQNYSLGSNGIVIDFGLPADSYAIDDATALKTLGIAGTLEGVTLQGSFVKRKTYEDYGFGFSYYYEEYAEDVTECLQYNLPLTQKVKVPDASAQTYFNMNGTPIYLSPTLLHDFLSKEYYSKVYTQASLFFENDEQAHEKVETLRDLGYVAVPSDETVKLDLLDRVSRILTVGSQIIGWFLTVVFVSLFLSLCSSRAMGATRGDIAIMRSMGIPTKVIRISVYVQTATALIPAFLVTGIACAVVYNTPSTNDLFPYLHASQYVVIGVLLLLISALLSHRYNRKMFEQSVKKTLKEGAAHV